MSLFLEADRLRVEQERAFNMVRYKRIIAL